MSDELENKLVGAIAMGELSGYWAGEYKDAMLKIKDLERQRDELVKLLKQVHLSGDCEWLYAEYGEVEWVGDRDELIASMGHTCRIQRKACVVCGKAVSLIAKAEKAG